MFTRLTVRHIAVAIVLTLGIVTVVSAQTNTRPSAPRGPMEELLAEVPACVLKSAAPPTRVSERNSSLPGCSSRSSASIRSPGNSSRLSVN